jgi:hypothetical protein
LSLLALENRITPAASISFLNGNLTVTGDNTANVIEVSGAAGSASVNVNGVFRGTYAITGRLTVNGGNSSDTILVRINGGASLPGDVLINVGNGNDFVFVDGNGGEGTIPGRLAISLGAGDDLVNLAAFGGLRVNGLMTIDGNVGNDTVEVGLSVPSRPAGVKVKNIGARPEGGPVFTGVGTFSGLTSLTGVNQFRSDAPAPGQTTFGQFIMNSGSEAVNSSFFPNNTTFGGDVTVITGGGNDSLTPIFGNTFNGNVLFSAGAGNNDSAPWGDNYFAGNWTYIGGNGSDFVFSAEPHAGNVSLLLGDGGNTVFTDFDQAGFLTVAGSVSIRGGNGNDTINPLLANISGNLEINLGNGNNAANIQSFVAGTVRYNGGGGVDTVEVGGANSYSLFVSLGAGNDVFTFTAGTTVGNADLDFGFGADTYNDNGVVVFWNFRLVNL